ncbi:hypothetical protein UF75_1581 [Desulfosporosinus sp. I2]|nr:hypothetical protein UF75_1581 [Desulfosporosinus sp. I2]
MLLVHGSPNRLNEYVTEEISEDYASELISLAAITNHFVVSI